MQVLPDIVASDPLVAFCGRAGAGTRPRDHYYETPGNNFWEMLHRSGLTPRRLRPDEDGLVAEHRLCLTDLVGGPDRYDVDIEALVAKVRAWGPEWLAFTSKSTAQEAAGVLGEDGRRFRRVGLGPADWYVGGAQVFVLPGTSGANRRRDYDGRVDRLSWWSDLAALVDR
jgi:TDG/mug DNA glycosylase family protein